MMEDPEEECMVEEREEFMVSPSGGDPFLRTAYFLKPTFPSSSSINEPPLKLPHCFSYNFDPKKSWPLKVEFRGWRSQPKAWKNWVDRMASVHHFAWKKAGIYEAIFNSTYEITRQDELIHGLAEKWCCDTNTFIFPWGEATITLEDVMVLGGFSVLGDSVLSPLATIELKEMEEKLNREGNRMYANGTVARSLLANEWMNKFMNSGDEFEHEAFLAFWLTRFVFHGASTAVLEQTISIAIHLAKGNRIANAPAVLASIYRDLGLLKKAIVDSTQLKVGDVASEAIIKSPFQLVQVWAWERFLEHRPNPNDIHLISPEVRMARWDEVSGLKVENLKMVLDSAGEDFMWRPYALAMENRYLPKYFPQIEKWVSVGSDFDRELVSFVRCLRVSELVGLGTIEAYHPHRVSMQFGYDQDLPRSVARSNHNSDIAWKHYSREIKNVKLYLPSRLFEADVSANYLKWWKKSVSGVEDGNETAESQKKKQKSTDWPLKRAYHTPEPPAADPEDEDKLTISEFLKHRKKGSESSEFRQVGDSGEVQNLASPPIAEVKSEPVSSIGNESPRSSSLFEKLVLEYEKRDSKLEARSERVERVVAELSAYCSLELV